MREALAGMYRWTVTLPEMLPVDAARRAVPDASDCRVRFPAEASVVLPSTVTVPDAAPPVMTRALPRVVVALPLRVRSFRTLVVPGVVWSK